MTMNGAASFSRYPRTEATIVDQTTTDYTTCSCCGSQNTLRPWGKVQRCSVCHSIGEPVPNREQIEQMKREAKPWRAKDKD